MNIALHIQLSTFKQIRSKMAPSNVNIFKIYSTDDDNARAVGEILARAPEKEDIIFSQRNQDESL